MKQENYAFVWPASTVDFVSASDPEFDPCDFAAAKETLFSGMHFSVAVGKGFPYAKLFNHM